MKIIIIPAFVTIFFIAVSCDSPPKFTTKYDNIDIDNIIKSERLLKNYVDCLLDKKRCSPEGAELKKSIPDALQNNCLRCSKKQEESIRKVMKHLIEQKYEWFLELEKKYDPNRIYRAKYIEEAKKSGIKLPSNF